MTPTALRQAAWENFTQDVLRKILESMPMRIEAVIGANVSPIG